MILELSMVTSKLISLCQRARAECNLRKTLLTHQEQLNWIMNSLRLIKSKLPPKEVMQSHILLRSNKRKLIS
jgi:hypothetical protein